MLPEQDAFIEALYRKYFKKLVIYATAALGNMDRAQDVVQDAFHQAVIDIDALVKHNNPGGWLMETVKYKVKDSKRARIRYLHRFLSLDSDVSAELFPSKEIITDPCESNGADLLKTIEHTLTMEEYRLLKRLIFDQASHLEVAQELGITVYASQKRLERVREKLYKVFPERKKKKK